MLRKTIDLRPALFACAVLLLIGCQSTSTSPNATLADEATAASVDALLAAAAAADLTTAARYRLQAIDLLIAANDLERATEQLQALPEVLLLPPELRALAQLARAALAKENGDFTRARSLLQELGVSAQETLPIDTMIKAALLAGDVYRNLGDPTSAATLYILPSQRRQAAVYDRGVWVLRLRH